MRERMPTSAQAIYAIIVHFTAKIHGTMQPNPGVNQELGILPRYNFPKLFATTGRFLDGRCELLLVPEKLVVALFHYASDQAVSVPIGFISGKAEHVEIARQVFEGLTSGKSPVYHAGDHDADLDLSDELTALRANFEMLPPSQ